MSMIKIYSEQSEIGESNHSKVNYRQARQQKRKDRYAMYRQYAGLHDDLCAIHTNRECNCAARAVK